MNSGVKLVFSFLLFKGNIWHLIICSDLNSQGRRRQWNQLILPEKRSKIHSFVLFLFWLYSVLLDYDSC